MENSLEEERAGFIAGEVGGAVVELIVAGEVISRDSIIDILEARLRVVGNTVHKGILRDTIELLMKGR